MRKIFLDDQLRCGQFTPAECGQINRRMHLSSEISLEKFNLNTNEWECVGLKLDTMYNVNFRPNPVFIPSKIKYADDSIKKIHLHIRELKYFKSENKLTIIGKCSDGEFGGWGTEVFIMTATRLDSIIPFYKIYENKFFPVDSIKCIYLKNIDFQYTNCNFLPRTEVELYCTLKIKNDNNLLVFAKNGYYVELFDLFKIKEKYIVN